MKRIAINGLFLTKSMTGVQRVAFQYAKNIKNQCKDAEIVILVPSKATINSVYDLSELPNIKRVGSFSGKVWEQVILPFYSKNFDVLLSFCNQSPVLSKNSVLLVHDAQVYLYPDSYSFLFKMWYRVSLPLMIRNAIKTITISNYSKETLIRYLGGKGIDIKVIQNGTDHFQTSTSGEVISENIKIVADNKYALVIGSLAKHKNLKVLVESINLYEWPLKLVIVGDLNSNVFKEGINIEHNDIIALGRVTDSELYFLLKNAKIFVSSSLFEGFGLPVSEALQYGIPTICSDIPVYREFFNNYVCFTSPLDPESWYGNVNYILKNPNSIKMRYKPHKWSSSTDSLLKELNLAE